MFFKLSKKLKNRREAAKIFWSKNEGAREIFPKSENKIDIAPTTNTGRPSSAPAQW